MHTPPVPSLATMLQQLRLTHGDITQEELADRVGLSGGMIAHVERGTRSLSVNSIDLIIEALDLSREDREQLRAARDIASAARSSKQQSGADDISALARTMQQIGTEIVDLTKRLQTVEQTLDALQRPTEPRSPSPPPVKRRRARKAPPP